METRFALQNLHCSTIARTYTHVVDERYPSLHSARKFPSLRECERAREAPGRSTIGKPNAISWNRAPTGIRAYVYAGIRAIAYYARYTRVTMSRRVGICIYFCPYTRILIVKRYHPHERAIIPSIPGRSSTRWKVFPKSHEITAPLFPRLENSRRGFM